MKHLGLSIVFISFCCSYCYAQRINNEGRKLVKTVKSYEWKGTEYKLREVYAMEYNSENELIKLSLDRCNGFIPTIYIREDNTIISDRKDYTKIVYHLNSGGKIVYAEEHEYFANERHDPYYTAIDFTYYENGQLDLITEKHLHFNSKNRNYKENDFDRRYFQMEYKNGGSYTQAGLSSNNGTEVFHSWDRGKERIYDTNANYDINFNIESNDLSVGGNYLYAPLLTEWCPTYPEYWVKRIDFGGYSKKRLYEYDEKGNVTAIVINCVGLSEAVDGREYRYEIEYVY